jgi:Cu/Ag efflux protein CusF
MKIHIPPSIVALFAILPLASVAADPAKHCGCACCQGKEDCCCREVDKAATSEPTPAPEAKPAETARHPLKGVVVEVRAAKHALLVKHEAIPGYMMAMTMLFRVDDRSLAAVKAGDAITGTLIERGDDYWLEDIQPVGK